MSNVTRIVRRNIASLEGPADPFDRRLRPKAASTVYKVTDRAGTVRYENARGDKASFPYRCAVRERKPYRGNSDRMRGAT